MSDNCIYLSKNYTMGKRKPITLKNAKHILSLVSEYGIAGTAETLGMKQRSVQRRLREIKKVHGLEGVTNEIDMPKILMLDIETAQMEVKVWSLINNNYIQPNRIVKPSFIICFSAKWLTGSEMMRHTVTPEEALARDDKRIMQEAWKLLDEADFVIGHNMKKFDRRKLNAKFFVHKMFPPSPYKVIDTLVESKKVFDHPSHKLDYISQLISNKHKIKTDIGLWDACEAGDPDALEQMGVYCDEDTFLLEEAYLELRPWIRPHPNLGLYLTTDDKHGQFACPNCAKIHDPEKVNWDGVYSTNISQFKTFRCTCGAVVRTRNSHKISPLMSIGF